MQNYFLLFTCNLLLTTYSLLLPTEGSEDERDFGMKKFFIPFLVIVFLFLMGQKRMERVYLIPIGEVNREVLEELRSSLKEKFHLEIVIREALPKPDYAYNRRRRQYHSSPILDNFSRNIPSDAYRVLGITELDLYVPNLNFIFGQAQMEGKTALISLARLREEFWGRKSNEKLLQERALKEAVHELGHTLGLEHCPNPECVMHFSNSLTDTDIKGSWFCPECEKKWRAESGSPMRPN